MHAKLCDNRMLYLREMLCTSSCDDRLVRHVRAVACRLRAVVSRRAAVEGFESDSKRDAAAASFLMVMQQRQLKVRTLFSDGAAAAAAPAASLRCASCRCG